MVATSWKVILFLYIFFQYSLCCHGKVAKISKICIVGGGIAGLSLTASLLKSATTSKNPIREIIICESRPELDQSKLGGGVQLTGGTQVLKQLGLDKELTARSLPIQQIICRNSQNQLLYALNLDELFAKQSSGGTLKAVTIMRNTLHTLLLQSIQQHQATGQYQPKIRFLPNHRIRAIETTDQNQAKIQFSDQPTIEEDIDLIIGCDGINSQIRQYLQTPQLEQSVLAATSQYLGIRITYCLTKSMSYHDTQQMRSTAGTGENANIQEMHQYMGDGVYVLIASYGQNADKSVGGKGSLQTMLAIVYRSAEDAILAGNDNWTTSDGKQQLLQQLQQRIVSGKLDQIEEIQKVMNVLKQDVQEKEEKFFDLGVRDRWLQSLFQAWYGSYSSSSTSTSKGIPMILIGDSAHPMAPFLGQGANQALVDAFILSQLIANYNENAENQDCVEYLGQRLEQERKLSTIQLAIKSNILGQIETLPSSWGMIFKDTFFRIVSAIGIPQHEYLKNSSPTLFPKK